VGAFKTSIVIYVSTKDRKAVTELCLTRLKETGAYIVVVDDHSKEYSVEWLKGFADEVYLSGNSERTPQIRLLNIIRQQLDHFKASEFKYAYFTDNDCYHHKDFLQEAMSLIKYNEPVGLYISKYNLENKLEEPFYSLNSGVSLFISKDIPFYDFFLNATKKDIPKWDGIIYKGYRSIGGKFAFPKYSLLEHFGAHGVNYKKGLPDTAQFLHPELKREIEDKLKHFYG